MDPKNVNFLINKILIYYLVRHKNNLNYKFFKIFYNINCKNFYFNLVKRRGNIRRRY